MVFAGIGSIWFFTFNVHIASSLYLGEDPRNVSMSPMKPKRARERETMAKWNNKQEVKYTIVIDPEIIGYPIATNSFALALVCMLWF